MAAAGFRAALLLALTCAACTSVLANERTFEGTRWHVVAIDGHATPASGRFSFEFARGSFTARFGCNNASGQYRVAGEMLIAPMTRATEMACDALEPGPISLMTYEQWGFRMLRQPMRMHWTSARRLTLDNSAGSIVLERIP